MASHLFLSVLLAAAGCGDDAPSADAAVDDAGDDDAGSGLLAPEPPEAPMLPDLRPCAPGWEAVEADGVFVCEPWTGAASPSCPDDHVGIPGQGCVALGTVCPIDGVPADLPATGVFHVDAGASGGDGSRASPFGTVDEALTVAGSGDVVALWAGDHEGQFFVPAGVTLRGACVTGTRLVGDGSASGGVILARSAGGAVENLTIGPATHSGLLAGGNPGASVRVEGVLIRSVRGAAVNAGDGGRVQLTRVAIRDVLPLVGADGFGRGLDVSPQGTLVAERVEVDRASEVGASALGDAASLTIRDGWIHGTRPRPMAGTFGVGVQAVRGATVVLERSVLEDNRLSAATSVEGSRLELRDVVVRRTRLGEPGAIGYGLQAADRGTAVVERSLFEDVVDIGVLATDPASTATLIQVVVRRVAAAGPGQGRGLGVEVGATVTADRLLVRDAGNSGIAVLGNEARFDGTDLTIQRVQSNESDGRFGRGLVVGMSASAGVTRAAIDRVRECGVCVESAGALAMEDVAIRDVEPRGVDGLFGRGLFAGGGSSLTGGRIAVVRATELGLMAVDGGTTVELDSLAVEDVRPLPNGTFGRGLLAQDGPVLTLRRARIVGVHDLGLAGVGAVVRGTDIEILDVRSRLCADDGRCEAPSGTGVGAYVGATVELRGFRIGRADLCGVQIAGGSNVDLHDGEVFETSTGACVQVDGFAFERLTDGVVYRDNGTNLDSTTLPVPEAGNPL